jgi:hypothetical protein
MFNDIITPEAKYPVFVIMSHSGSLVSTVIRRVTGQPYSHASVSFDPSLKGMYSFGSGKLSRVNYIVGGFAKENFKDFKLFDPETTYSMYVAFVDRYAKDAMISRLEEITAANATRELKYNFIGLLYNAFGKVHDRGDVYFCSQFVDTILKAGDIGFKKHSSLVRPADFRNLKGFQFVTKGLSANYDEVKVRNKVQAISEKENITPLYESTMPANGGFFELI